MAKFLVSVTYTESGAKGLRKDGGTMDKAVSKNTAYRAPGIAPSRLGYAVVGGGAGVRPWRRMISAIIARSGGPPAARSITSAASRKNCGPIAAGVMRQSAFTS